MVGRMLKYDTRTVEFPPWAPTLEKILCATETFRNITTRVISLTLVERSTTFKKSTEGSELANMVANDAKIVANLFALNDANLPLPPRLRQVLIESPL
ncbi:hypothetical protein TNCV_2980441 [Trichonephila clavipes]|nr:hypothetical protein TNCV_2980441 [Trichonephila clavipes]